jgi:hypothetical protein
VGSGRLLQVLSLQVFAFQARASQVVLVEGESLQVISLGRFFASNCSNPNFGFDSAKFVGCNPVLLLIGFKAQFV